MAKRPKFSDFSQTTFFSEWLNPGILATVDTTVLAKVFLNKPDWMWINLVKNWKDHPFNLQNKFSEEGNWEKEKEKGKKKEEK